VSCCCCFGFALFFARTWVTVGYAHAVEETVRTGAADVSTLFDARGRFVNLVLARLAVFVAGTAGLLPIAALGAGAAITEEMTQIPEPLIVLGTAFGILLYLPVYLYVMLGFTFVVPSVALDGRGVGDSLAYSWKLAAGKRLRLFVYLLVLFVVGVAGLLACGVGVLVTGSLGHAAIYESWLAWTRGDAYRESWLATSDAPRAASPTIS
jgi:hypothetical protein